MKKIIYGIICCLCLMGCQKKTVCDKDNLKIIVASDLHYFLKDYYQDCDWFEESMLYGDGKMVTYGDEIVDAFISAVLHEKPELVILTGDLSFNGEKGSHQQLAQKLEQLREKDIQVAVIPGNHDIDNIYTKGYGKDDYFDVENIDAKTFQDIYQDLGYHLAVSKHDESLSYRIDLNEDYSLLMMDSNAHEQTEMTLGASGFFTESTMQWLEEQLQDIQKQKKIPLIAMHHNLAIHNELLNNGYTINDHEKIAKLFSQYHVPFVLSGHMHCQNIKTIQGIYDIASSSLLDAPLQYGIIELNQQQMNYHTKSLSISVNADEYFDTVSANKFGESLQGISDTQKREAIQDVLVKANRYYFTGNINQYVDELRSSDGYQYLQNEDLSFYQQYLESMLKETESSQSLQLSLTMKK